MNIVNKIISECSEMKNNIKALQLRALLSYKMDKYEECERDITDAV